MISLKVIAFTTILAVSISYVSCAIPGGSNTYLPPTNGYDYPRPPAPFPPGPVQTTRRPAPLPPKPTYLPPGPAPPPGPRPTPPRPSGPGQRPPGADLPPDHPDHVHVPGMPFDFEYSVNDIETANDYSHKAVSDGDVTRGEYRVQLPDGRTQIVRYTADWKTGYHAEVSYEGQARFPEGPSVFGGQAAGGGSGGYRY